MKYDVCVIGGGVSGLVAALTAAERGFRTIVIEKNVQTGKKLSASGNGRGNILNTGKPRYYGDSSFAASVTGAFDAERQISWWNKHGLQISVDEERRAYPVTGSASSVCEILHLQLKRNDVEVRLSTRCTDIEKTGTGFTLALSDGTFIECRNAVIACGGAAQPRLGGSSDGYLFLKKFGHTITEISPALTQIVSDKRSVSGLAGIRVKAAVRIEDESGEILHHEAGEVLFTEYGISGICAMQCARFAYPGSKFIIDISDSFGADVKGKLKEHRMIFGSESITVLMTGILHPRIAYAVLKQSDIVLKNRECKELTDNELTAIANTISRYTMYVESVKGLDTAQVTAGGARCTEFDRYTMESRLISHLFAAGEVLDVDGDCGGFNIMFAVASGYIAGNSVRK